MIIYEEEILFRLFIGFLGGIVLSYFITIAISLTIGDGTFSKRCISLCEAENILKFYWKKGILMVLYV